MSKAETMIRVTVAYLLAFGAATAYLGPDSDQLWLDALIADLIATVVVFAASRWHHNSSFYDPYWSILPPYLAVYWVVASNGAGDDARTALVLGVVVLWAVRLTANWVIGFPGLHHEDWRYPMLRDRAGKLALPVDFFAIHLIPTFQTFLGTVPVYVAVALPGRDLGWLDGVALVVGLGAVAVELIADGQMRRFVRARTAALSWTAGCGAGRATPTTSARSASGSRSHCSASPRRPVTGGGSSPVRRPCSRCSSVPASP